MKRFNFINPILIAFIVLSFIFPLKALCDDEVSTFDILCRNVDFFHYIKIFDYALMHQGIFYHRNQDAIPLKSIILYLERQEKPPPTSAFLFST